MVITYHGGHFLRISHGDTVLAVNPPEKSSGTSSFGADIALSSASLPEMSGFETVTRGEKSPFRISGPGEYEVKNLFVEGVGAEVEKGGRSFINTMYSFSIDGITVLVLGALAGDVPASAREGLLGPDIIVLPISDMPAAAAYKLAVSFDPGLILPVDYENKKDALPQFLKEAGENPKAEEKITLKRKDLEGKEAEIILLKNT